jgi:hypothetical protein
MQQHSFAASQRTSTATWLPCTVNLFVPKASQRQAASKLKLCDQEIVCETPCGRVGTQGLVSGCHVHLSIQLVVCARSVPRSVTACGIRVGLLH